MDSDWSNANWGEDDARYPPFAKKVPSDSGYEVRVPRSVVKARSSNYGPDFYQVEEGRNASISTKERIPLDESYERPRVAFSTEMVKDYDNYKNINTVHDQVVQTYRAIEAEDANDTNEKKLDQLKSIRPHLKDATILASETSAARMGFNHKYPHAYHTAEAKENHEQQALNMQTSVRNKKTQLNRIEREIDMREERSRGGIHHGAARRRGR